MAEVVSEETLDGGEMETGEAQDGMEDLNITVDLGQLDLTTEEDIDLEDIGESIKENLNDDVVRAALEKGLNLRDYLMEVDLSLQRVEQESFQDYLQEGVRLARLHGQIRSCDGILGSMQGSLLEFQKSLGAISSEIEVLQAQSIALDQKLNNRKALQAPLLSFITNCTIAPELIEGVCKGEVNEQYCGNLDAIEGKMAFAEQLEGTRLGPDVITQLTMLREEACRRVRQAMLERVGAMRKPLSNIEVHQNALLKLRRSFDFLVRHAREAAVEIKEAYVDTMGKIHFTYFKEYTERLRKLQEDLPSGPEDLLAVEDSSRRSFFGSRTTPKARTALYAIGQRAAVLTQLEAPVIVPHTVGEGRLSYETIFRSTQYALLEIGAREYLFCQEFLGLRDQRAYEAFKAILGRTMTLFLQNLQAHLARSFDPIGLALCACMSAAFQTLLRTQDVPCLQPYFEQVDELLWPRIEALFESHIESVRSAGPTTVGVPDPLPHFVVRRGSDMLAALLAMLDGRTFAVLTRVLGTLREEVENFILRMAAELHERKDQLVFVINNFDLLRSAFRDHPGHPDAPALEKIIADRTREYVEEALRPSFGGIMAFVRDTEVHQARGVDLETIPIDQRRIQGLIRAFAADWKRAIDAIDADVMRSFSNFKVGTVVLQEVLTQLVVYYERFLTILRQPGIAKRTGTFSDLIDRHHIIVEVKKHKPAL
eukprot:m.34679 g.34679  ORF g.34679 m.34679 type:complete len:710 (+) comp9546_c0_seq3:57-2186(+)